MRELAEYCNAIPVYRLAAQLTKERNQLPYAPQSIINFANFIYRNINAQKHPQFEDLDAAIHYLTDAFKNAPWLEDLFLRLHTAFFSPLTRDYGFIETPATNQSSEHNPYERLQLLTWFFSEIVSGSYASPVFFNKFDPQWWKFQIFVSSQEGGSNPTFMKWSHPPATIRCSISPRPVMISFRIFHLVQRIRAVHGFVRDGK